MKKIIILGSTGSIGKNTLKVLDLNPNKFEVIALSCNKNVHEFVSQILKYKPKFAIMQDEILLSAVKTKTKHIGTKFISGEYAFENLAQEIDDNSIDCLVSAISGIAGMSPTLTLLPKCKTLAIANKETIVCAGKFLIESAKKHNVKIIPIDSEHNSAWQILQKCHKDDIESILITASGGAFLGRSLKSLENIKLSDIHHPNWQMGIKNTIDSCTMANKALEMMEGWVLFDVLKNNIQIDALLHAKSIVHAMVELKDKSTIAFMSKPNMQLHIANAIFDGRNNAITETQWPTLKELSNLDFAPIPHDIYKSFYLGCWAMKHGYEHQIVFNAANEFAVEKFIEGKIGYLDISKAIDMALSRNINFDILSIENILKIHTEVYKFLSNRFGI